jgi:hypothetical protein
VNKGNSSGLEMWEIQFPRIQRPGRMVKEVSLRVLSIAHEKGVSEVITLVFPLSLENAGGMMISLACFERYGAHSKKLRPAAWTSRRISFLPTFGAGTSWELRYVVRGVTVEEKDRTR